MKAEEVIIDAVIEASRKLPLDAVKALEKAYEVEEGNSKVVLKAILDNLDLAGSLEIPLCQDTGIKRGRFKKYQFSSSPSAD